MRLLWLAIPTAAIVLAASPLAKAGPPDGYELRRIASGLNAPTAFAFGPDGRIYIAEQGGHVRVLADGRLRTFLDLSDEVNRHSDRGLNNLIVDRRGRVYLFFTAELRKDDPDKGHPAGGRLLRVEPSATDPYAADPESRVTLISGFDSHGPWHSVGGLDFDAQGNLVVGFGDGSPYYPREFSADAFVVYDLDSLSGKVLRIDPETGRGVSSNPYFDADRPDAVRSKVLARGFRMPYRLTVDRETGSIYVGDVGTDQWEEIDVIEAAWTNPDRELNYGWPCYEGGDDGTPARRYANDPYCTAEYFERDDEEELTRAPAYAYEGTGGAAIVVGPFAERARLGESVSGSLFVADFIHDRLFTYRDGEASDFGSDKGWGAPTDLGLTPRGTLVYTAFLAGELNEVVYVGGEDGSSRSQAKWLGISLVGAAIVLAGALLARRMRAHGAP